MLIFFPGLKIFFLSIYLILLHNHIRMYPLIYFTLGGAENQAVNRDIIFLYIYSCNFLLRIRLIADFLNLLSRSLLYKYLYFLTQ